MTYNEASKESSFLSHIVIPSAISSVIGAVGSIILIMLFAAFLSFSDVSEGYLGLFGYMAIAIGAFLCGLSSSMKYRKKGLVSGLISGAFMFFVLFIFRLILAGADTFTISSFFQLLVIVLLSGLGGIMGVNLKRKRK